MHQPKSPPSVVKVLTYNVRFHNALSALPDIISLHTPDIICLQEVNLGKRLDEVMHGVDNYSLAASSPSFYRWGKVYGLATLYRHSHYYLVGSKSIFLPKSNYEIVMTSLTGFGPRTALKTDFIDKKSGAPISTYNIHLTALIATNKARDRQLAQTLDDLDLSRDSHTVIAGDFNYPFRKRGLERIIREYQLHEATSNISHTATYQFFRRRFFWKFDFVLYKDLKDLGTQRLDEHTQSDHFPILTTFEY